MKAKKLFIVAYGGGHINIQLRVAEYFSERGWKVTFLSVPNTTNILKSTRFEVITFSNIATQEEKKLGRKYIDKIHNDKSNIDIEESIAYTGVNLSSLVNIYGKERAEKLFLNFGRRVFLPINSLITLFKREKPDLVSVTLSAARSERAAIIAANKLNIKVMAMEDLFGTACAFSIYDDLYVKKLETKNELIEKGVLKSNIYVNSQKESFQVASFHTGIEGFIGIRYKYQPNYVFCINEFAKEQLILRGIEENKIYVVGQPALDHTFIKTRDAHKEDLILVTTQPLDTCERFLKLIKNTIIDLSKKYKVVIRYHPSCDGELERQYLDNINNNIIIDRNQDIYTLLSKAKLVLTQTSTTAIEAAIAEAAVLSLSLGNDNLISFEDAGVALEMINPQQDEVRKKIHFILENQDFHSKPEGIKYCDGNSLERIHKIVLNN